MQPKPIDFRSVLDVDRQRRVVNMEGFAEHLRALRESKENPGETDYDVTHDEDSHRDSEETSRKSTKNLTKTSSSGEETETDRKDSPKARAAPANSQKGTRLDIEA